MPSRQNQRSKIINPGPRRSVKRDRGVALIITLILLALLGAISLALVLLVSSDTMINGYYRNYRGSFYAADSGVNVVVESIKASLQTAGVQTANPPLPINGTLPATVAAAYAPYQANYYVIGDTGSWKGQFEMVANPGGTAVIGTPTYTQAANPNDSNSHWPCTPSCDGDYIWTFSYPYTVTVKGQSSGTEAEEITQTGVISYTSISGSGSSAGFPSFAKWGAFITNFAACQGPLVPGTSTGPFFTDGQWNFGNDTNPGYTFTDSIGQVGSQASWWNNNNCSNSASAPKGFTQPNFESGFQTSQSTINAPADNYNQLRAVLDAEGTTDSAPSQTMMSQELKTISGTIYPATGTPPTGVYIPYYTNSSGMNVFGASTAAPLSSTTGAAGGFYVNGNASVTLAATTGGDGTSNPTQTYTITQGSTTTTIIVNDTASTTTVKSGSTTLSLTGVPTQLDGNGNPITQTDPSGSTVNPTLVYVNGQITAMSGTVQNDVGAMVTASGNISITGDITYASAPVSIPSDVLNSTTNAGVLGIFTTGNINLYPNSSGSNAGNLTVDASMAAINGSSSGGTSGFETPGNGINTWTIVGGRSEDQAHSVNINAGNTYYDRRFANNFGPPWFPTAVPGTGYNPVGSSESLNITRSSWQEVNR